MLATMGEGVGAESPGEMPRIAAVPRAGNRLVRRVAGLLLTAQAAMMLAAVPVIAVMFMGSLWEGGDAALKHRLLGWAMFAVLGNLIGVVLLGVAVAALLRGRSARRATAATCATLVTVLAAGWAWVYQGYLLSDPATLGEVALFTLPGLVGSVLASAAPEA